MTTLELVHGVIDRVNQKGFRLQGEADWRNYSRYADPADILPPDIGAAVAVSVDSQGFVRSVQVLLGQLPEKTQEMQPASAVPIAQRPDRDTTITRLAVLKAAATVVSSQGGDASDVMTIAELFEEWVQRC